MIRPLFLLFVLAVSYLAAADICNSLPLLTVDPPNTTGKAGTLRTYNLTVNNTNKFDFCSNSYLVNASMPSSIRPFTPSTYPFIFIVEPKNRTNSVLLTFSSIPNASDASYAITLEAIGASYEGVSFKNSTTALYIVSGRALDQPDLLITSYGYHCFDRTGIPRQQCYLYDEFSLDNVTINNTGNGSFRGLITFKASMTGPNLTHEFVEETVPPMVPRSAYVLKPKKALVVFSVSGSHQLNGEVFTDLSLNESNYANNVYSISIPVSAGYPPGCFYNNPSCQAGYSCKDNQCIPVIEPTPSPTPSEVTPTPQANDTPSGGNATATPIAGVNASDVDDLANQARKGGENASEIDALLNQSRQLQSQGRLAEAKALLEQARQKALALVEKTRAAKTNYILYASFAFLGLLLLAIAALVIRKKKREETARQREEIKKPSIVLPPLTPESFEKPKTPAEEPTAEKPVQKPLEESREPESPARKPYDSDMP